MPNVKNGEVLDTLEVSIFARWGVSFAATTLATCYVVNVALGQTTWLPYPEELNVAQPACFLFRYGIVTSASLLLLNSLCFLFYCLRASSPSPSSSSSSLASLVRHSTTFALACTACAGLALAAATTLEDSIAQNAAAQLAFFGGYLCYMSAATVAVWQLPAPSSSSSPSPASSSSWSLSSRATKATLTAALAAGLLLRPAAFVLKWGAAVGAAGSWLAVAAILAFNWSMTAEYGSTMVLATFRVAGDDEAEADE